MVKSILYHPVEFVWQMRRRVPMRCAHFPIFTFSVLRSIKRRQWVKTRYINTTGRMQHSRWNTKCISQLRNRFLASCGIFDWSPLSAPGSSISPLLQWNPFSLCVRSVLCVNVKRSRWHQRFHIEKKSSSVFTRFSLRTLRWIRLIFESDAYVVEVDAI